MIEYRSYLPFYILSDVVATPIELKVFDFLGPSVGVTCSPFVPEDICKMLARCA